MSHPELAITQPEIQSQPEWLPEAREKAGVAIEQFTMNPGLESVAKVFDPTFEELKTPDERLDRLMVVARQNWDFRKGAERQDVVDQAEIDDPASPIWKTVFDAAQATFGDDAKPGLNMVDHPLSVKEDGQPEHFDLLVIPGGANKAPYDRLRFALEQNATYDTVVALGSERKVGPAEAKKAGVYAPGAQTEFDLQVAATQNLLNKKLLVADDVLKIGTAQWRIKQFEGQDGKPTFVLSAPAQEGRKRANTADTYDFMRRIAQEDLAPGTRVLLSTTAHFVPFQHFDALREITLQTGADVTTIGHSAEYGGNVRKPSQLLQEMLSAVNSAALLRDAIRNGHQ